MKIGDKVVLDLSTVEYSDSTGKYKSLRTNLLYTELQLVIPRTITKIEGSSIYFNVEQVATVTRGKKIAYQRGYSIKEIKANLVDYKVVMEA